MRVVMWSGPRNLSTAMMRSFGARADCDVVDEPFYGAFLHLTGIGHPMREAVMASMETDWRRVAARCAEDPAPGRIRYEKHMTHHMVDGVGLDWMEGAAVAFLIRDPREVAASYAVKREMFELADLGFERQAELFDAVTEMLGRPPPVIDAADVRRDPRRTLSALCAALGIPFDPAMLAWPPGRRESDGVWAAHWYAAVEASTGFSAPGGPQPSLPPEIASLIAPASDCHARLSRHALR